MLSCRSDVPRNDAFSDNQPPPPRKTDIIVVGAGIAGCAAAITFGRQGRRVLLLEKSLKEPTRLSGEVLQPGGVKALHALGLDKCLEGIDAQPTYGYCISQGGGYVKVAYSREGGKLVMRETGRTLHHGRFVQKLREEAMRTPNVTVVETKVMDLVFNHSRTQVVGVTGSAAGELPHGRTGDDGGGMYDNRTQYLASLIIISDGAASTLRRILSSPRPPVLLSKCWGVLLRGAELPYADHAHMILSTRTPIFLHRVSHNMARVLVDIPGSARIGSLKAYLLNTVLPALPTSCQGSFQAAVHQGQLQSMPTWYRPDSGRVFPSLLLLGDALDTRSPIIGGGMTIALKDIVLVTDLLAPENLPSLEDADTVLRAVKKFHRLRRSYSRVLNVLAMVGYSVVAKTDPTREMIRNGVFYFLQHGDSLVQDAAQLVAGLTVNPWSPVLPALVVLLCSIWLRAVEGPGWRRPWILVAEVVAIVWETVMLFATYAYEEFVPLISL